MSKLTMTLNRHMPGIKPADLRLALHASTFEAVTYMHGDIVSVAFGGHIERRGMFYASAPGNFLASRESQGARSRINSDVLVTGNEVYGVVGTPDLYVLYNEVGAHITPRHGKFLALPTINMLTPTGRLREEWAAKFAGGRSWRDLDWKQEGLRVLKSKKRGTEGGWIVRQRGTSMPQRGKGGRMSSTRPIEFLALLVREVNLPGRWMFKHSAKRTAARVSQILGRGVTIVVQKAA